MRTMTAATDTDQRTHSSPEVGFRKQPPYHVVLTDDDEHTYDYVIEMLQRLFGIPAQRAYVMATEVDTVGRAVVDTTTKERAEFKRDQIHAYGCDWRIQSCLGSMKAVIEAAAQ